MGMKRRSSRAIRCRTMTLCPHIIEWCCSRGAWLVSIRSCVWGRGWCASDRGDLRYFGVARSLERISRLFPRVAESGLAIMNTTCLDISTDQSRDLGADSHH